tara:strand:+ start:278 stop:427 length:150 start_codon:yes stop_codon:yes gene_type:complete
MRKSKKLFVFFVIIWVILMILIIIDFSKKSVSPWKKSKTNTELSINLIL